METMSDAVLEDRSPNSKFRKEEAKIKYNTNRALEELSSK